VCLFSLFADPTAAYFLRLTSKNAGSPGKNAADFKAFHRWLT
jgi:hypothetical protein